MRALTEGCVVDFDNFSDVAITQTDDTIRQAIGTSATVMSDVISDIVPSGVFDDPENTGHATSGTHVKGTNPSLFVKSAIIRQLA